jgi:hypothetical protein
MRIYHIKVWGPKPTEDEVRLLLDEPPNNRATVFAPSTGLAKQLCYIASTSKAHWQSIYQDIKVHRTLIPCVIYSTDDPYFFKADMIRELVLKPILPPKKIPDPDSEEGVLCRVAYHIPDTDVKGSFWVFASNVESARVIAGVYGEIEGFFNLDKDSVSFNLREIKEPCVFWNPAYREFEHYAN